MENDFAYLDVIYNCADKHDYELFCKLLKEVENKVDDPILFLCRRYDFDKDVFVAIVTDFQCSENFLREFKDIIDWECVSLYQNLSEDFIRDFSDRVRWDLISSRQKMSEEFINEFCKKINWIYLEPNESISDEIKKKVESVVMKPLSYYL